ncbi:hypothetical protein N7510_001703 [Penicillium lagena]|uniref:uncharacterized protein n=1 Tax=Penicillium lagena TaxID=94218 RepID=UPI002541DD9A|nr:uncharacterized protein N7510_001703 [Penicillium lagena]KAJ5625394.1 hypothetical protein N7510_001703 [Penicillium lagena]
MQPSSIINNRAKNHVAFLADSLDRPEGIGSMSAAIYDTAWLAMISKTESDGSVHWLFPECFQILVESQSAEGGFNGWSADVDAILHTMAALLALLKHDKQPSTNVCPCPSDIKDRIARGEAFLRQRLASWDVESTVHVGFEILVPTLLEQLQLEGLNFKFPGSAKLLAINQQKLARFSPNILYASVQSTLLHSLEAFVGMVDFDKLSHHLRNGSMMGSPSSTAAYLMNCSHWDPVAEAYLRSVVAARQGKVPSAFPNTVFALTWKILSVVQSMSTLMESGYTADELGSDNMNKLAGYLEAQLEAQKGVVGFAPGVLPDADDTAKALISLSQLGRPVSCERLIDVFETPTHFMTYPHERNESFSANCNVLKAILHSKNPSSHLPQICKAVAFLTRSWYAGKVNDKWVFLTFTQNLEVQYSMMLLSEAFTLLLKLWEEDSSLDLPQDLIANRVPIVLFQILARTLSSQSEDGSWGQKPSAEITAYGTLTLKQLGSLAWAKALEPEIQSAISRGVSFLENNQSSWDQSEQIWIEKVSYGSSLLCEAYCLAAMKHSGKYAWGEKVSGMHSIPLAAVDKFSKLFSRLPALSSEPEWKLRMSAVEGFLFGRALRQVRLDVFPRKGMGKDKYFDYVPICWTAANNAAGFGLSADIMWDMIVLSMLVFQVDEYLESVGEQYKGRLDEVRTIIQNLFHERTAKPQANDQNGISQNGHVANGHIENGHVQNGHSHNADDAPELLAEVKSTLTGLIDWIMNHPKVHASPPAAKKRLSQQTTAFLLAHIQQADDNARLFNPGKTNNNKPEGTFFNWVCGTGAENTGGIFSLEYFGHLLAPKAGKECFRGAVQKYLFQDLGRHLASVSRQYNDLGSVARDRDEGNLNSLDFTEFHENGQKNDQAGAELLRIATYERDCIELVIQKLRREVESGTVKAIEAFVNATDLFGQVYVMKDLGTRLK